MSYLEDEECCPNCGNLDIEFDNDERGCYCCGFSWGAQNTSLLYALIESIIYALHKHIIFRNFTRSVVEQYLREKGIICES